MDCFKSNGSPLTESRYPGEFSGVKVFDKIDLNINPGPVYKVEVSAYSHIIKNISTSIRDGVLYIDNNNSCNFVRGYKKIISVTITVPGLTTVENWGVGITRINKDFSTDVMKIVAESSGDIYLNGYVRKLSTFSNGNGDIYLNGSCDSLDIYMGGTNFLYGNDFVVKEYVLTQTQSLGDCFLNATTVKKIDYAIYRNGNIYYKGNPAIINNLNPENVKGKLLKED